MAKIVNLRLVKKQAARVAARAKGDENAAKHGQTLANRGLMQARAEQSARALDGHRRDTPATDVAAAPKPEQDQP